MKKEYLKIGFAKDLKNKKDRRLFRFLEIMPGVLSLSTLLLFIFLSWHKPVWVAVFIIIFDIYWLLKTLFLSFHQQSALKKLKKNLNTDWIKKLNELSDWKNIYQLVIFPMYKEGIEIVRPAFKALINSNYPLNNFIVVLAVEERAGDQAKQVAEQIKKEFGNKFFKFLIAIHPKNIEGELAGKGSNETWAAKKAKKLIDELNISYKNVIVSSFDIDTQVYEQYFACLTYHYLTCKNPLQSSFQPIPIYNNNIWDSPAKYNKLDQKD